MITEEFGNIMYNGKMVDLDKLEVEKLEEISADLKTQCEVLKRKSESIFKQ